jgi:hypothetical protein
MYSVDLHHKLAPRLHFVLALQALSEDELLVLRHRILSVLLEIQILPGWADEFVQEVTATQGRLARCYELVESIFFFNQQKATYDQLCNWDNEGGQVAPFSQ